MSLLSGIADVVATAAGVLGIGKLVRQRKQRTPMFDMDYDLFEDVISKLRFESMTRGEQWAQCQRIWDAALRSRQ